MEFNIQTMIIGLLGGAVIAATGYLKSGETFVPLKMVQTTILGGIAGAVIGFTGVQVTDANLAVQIAALGGMSGGIAIGIENLLKWLKLSPATNVIATAATVSDSSIYNPAQHNNQPVWSVPWDTMKQWVQFRTSDVTKANMLAGVVSATDRATILDQISKAEATNEYLYTITFSKGFFEMKAVADPVGTNEYKYQVIVSSSGMDKQ